MKHIESISQNLTLIDRYVNFMNELNVNAGENCIKSCLDAMLFHLKVLSLKNKITQIKENMHIHNGSFFLSMNTLSIRI